MTANQHTSQTLTDTVNWHLAARVEDFPENGGACVYVEGKQIAVFNFSARNEWYACQNMCPHKQQMILSRGMIGSQAEEPKVACPFHKKTFSLLTGKSLNGDTCDIDTYPIRVEEGVVYIGLS
ncbi:MULTISPECIES: nitrite reductase small subunit NirD [unclassified Imperialibacter]|uniref:nitrite reductase small subunit NirD n=1 Tax=unclassified Imperialibacter TaxID=2629706 RepID=UPI00125170F7|nr:MULTISPECIES: nitrite reductase small subunit NirD [unclassified Imperialibacter]CAD5264532.1 Nitrite reductase [Imperialibacter sp. 89]CAD5269443.1 Nitrite reductase [Imperialibacter sp. 75]VVT09065.1 Nitrite reductase [Imperialibacter sp. EC-SDR9]